MEPVAFDSPTTQLQLAPIDEEPELVVPPAPIKSALEVALGIEQPSGGGGLSPAAIAGIVLAAVVALAAVLGLVYHRRGKRVRTHRARDAAMQQQLAALRK